MKRQQVLQTAWKTYAGNAPDDGEAFRQGWMQARAKALEAEGMGPVFR